MSSSIFTNERLNLLALACLACAIIVGQADLAKLIGQKAYLPDLSIRTYFLSLSSIVTALYLYRNYKYCVPSAAFVVIVAPVLVLAAFISLNFLQDDKAILAWSILADFCIILVCCVVVYLNVPDEGALKKFLWLLVLASICADISDVAVSFFRGSGVFTSITASRINFVGVACAYFLVFFEVNRRSIYAACVLVLVSFFFMLMSSSKTGVLVSVLSLGVICFFLSVLGRWRGVLIVIILALLSACGFWLSGSAHRTGERFADAFGRGTLAAGSQVDGVNGALQSSGGNIVPDLKGRTPLGQYVTVGSERICFVDRTERVQLWSYAISLFLKAPLSGVGFDGYRLLIPHTYDTEVAYFEYRYPHNILLDYLAKAGIVGFGIVLISILACASIYAKAVLYDYRYIFISGIFIFMFLVSMTGGDLYDVRYIWIFAAALAGALREKLSMVSQPQNATLAPVNA